MIKKIAIFCFLILPVHLFAQANKPLTTLKQLTDSINTIVQQQHMIGLMLGITTRDSTLFSGGFGYADLQAKRKVNGQTLFRLGSVTKSFVAVAVLQLVEQGVLNLNDKLHDIAPEVPFENQWEKTQPLRIIDLLEHTTGFDDMKLNEMYTLEQKNYTNKEMMLFQAHSMICRWPPGERESYCNVNYVILGYIIKKLTGIEYGQYLQEKVLAPLGMLNSNFDLFPKNAGLDVKEYIAPGGWVTIVPSVTVLIGPAASLLSSSDDMLKFIRFLLENGKPLLKESSIETMETPHSSLAARAGLKSGYAVANEDGHYYNKYSWRGHEGIVGTCNSHYLYNRELGLGFVLSCNGNSSIQPIENLVSDFLERNQPNQKFPAPKPLDLQAIQPYLGVYQNAAPRYELLSLMDMFGLTKVELTNKTIDLNEFGRQTKLIPTGGLIFKKEDANTPTIVFSKNESGDPLMIIDGVYCRQVNAFWAYTKIAVLLVALLFIISSFFLPIAALIAALRKKLTMPNLPLYLLPLLSISSLTWAMTAFSKVQAESYLLYQLREVSPRSLAIFAGTLLFGLLTTVNIFWIIKAFHSFRSRFSKGYFLITAISFMLITIMLLFNGWIGLCTWTM
jgi:CubicO group peptidase (beta-lactamase class C family)